MSSQLKRDRIAILVKDGIVQEICSTNPDLVVEVFDLDSQDDNDDLESGSYDDYVVQNKMVNVY